MLPGREPTTTRRSKEVSLYWFSLNLENACGRSPEIFGSRIQ